MHRGDNFVPANKILVIRKRVGYLVAGITDGSKDIDLRLLW